MCDAAGERYARAHHAHAMFAAHAAYGAARLLRHVYDTPPFQRDVCLRRRYFMLLLLLFDIFMLLLAAIAEHFAIDAASLPLPHAA